MKVNGYTTKPNAKLKGANLRGANLRCADLSNIDLKGANLRGANLEDVDLYGADLGGADLYRANLRHADLRQADLYRADLIGANLKGADLNGADLRDADLRHADLYRANLRGADLGGADLTDVKVDKNTKGYYLICPKKGAFIAYKKCQCNVIVTLKVLASSKRSSATTKKCRCSKAEVVEISNGEKVAYSTHDHDFKYELGKMVEVKDFDNDRWVECGSGIHFFMTKKEAEKY